jgi:hypothetical protein
MSSIPARMTDVGTARRLLREARVGTLLPDTVLGPRTVRRSEAIVVVVPGAGGLEAYLARLDAAAQDFAAWDGRVSTLPAGEEPTHRALVVDRYGQVYAVFDGPEDALPDRAALEEWFRFLATACPECGVLDDPIGRGWVP